MLALLGPPGGATSAMSDETVPAALLLAGYEGACRRFYAVMNTSDRDVTFVPLFEALSWAVSIDDRFKDVWKAAGPTSSRGSFGRMASFTATACAAFALHATAFTTSGPTHSG